MKKPKPSQEEMKSKKNKRSAVKDLGGILGKAPSNFDYDRMLFEALKEKYLM